MKLLKHAFIVTLFFAAAVSFADTEKGHKGQSMSLCQTSGISRIWSCDKLLGCDVRSSDGDIIGTVKEITGDSSQNMVKYVVVKSDALHPVPFSACTISSTAESKEDVNDEGKKKISWYWSRKKSEAPEIALNITRTQLQNAPSVDSLDIDELSAPALQQQIRNYYSKFGTSASGMYGSSHMPSGATTAKGNMFRISDAVGMKVNNMQDEKIGKIKDVCIDSRQGTIAYALVSHGGLGRSQVAAVPWSAVTIDIAKMIASLDADKDKLRAAALEKSDIARLQDSQFASHIFEVFGAQPYWGVYGYEQPSEQKKAAEDSNTPPIPPDINEPNKVKEDGDI